MTASTSQTPSAHLTLGRFGETWAARHLTDEGLVLLERNWRGPSGEIDLVLREGRTLVICEVKTRRSRRRGSGIEAVDETKCGRLRALAEEWMAARGVRPADVRVDVVDLLVEDGRVTDVDHVRGVA